MAEELAALRQEIMPVQSIEEKSEEKPKESIPEVSVKDLDKRILRIQRSTKTTFPFMEGIHNSLRMKNKAYYSWHTNPFASLVHYTALAIVITTV
ncbi:MAG: hypothetical protein NTW50_01960, partial [Candidatus Berkelbacteria bacterium]|nr:hypothetical protein [Candidatus Berkelbacteria bacterium]